MENAMKKYIARIKDLFSGHPLYGRRFHVLSERQGRHRSQFKLRDVDSGEIFFIESMIITITRGDEE
jgi:hypothetical protein